VTTPDVSYGVTSASKQAQLTKAIPAVAAAAAQQPSATTSAARPPAAAAAPANAAVGHEAKPAPPAAAIGPTLDAILGKSGAGGVPARGAGTSETDTSAQLLNFLLSP
jgi:hypothetical protein